MDEAVYLTGTRRPIAVRRPVATSRAKRALDVVLALALGLLLAPLLLLLGLAVRLDSPGGALFVQERIGLGGRRFRMLKFRSMRVDADETVHRDYVRSLLSEDAPAARGEGHVTGGAGGASVYKLTNDPRVTRVGAWLRRTSLDELPQLWNVLVGDMSIVGPRPPLAYEVELYDDRQRVRLEARPGITGLWQVSGRNLMDYKGMCEIDGDYVRQWSFALDLKILAKTIPVVLTNSGHAH